LDIAAHVNESGHHLRDVKIAQERNGAGGSSPRLLIWLCVFCFAVNAFGQAGLTAEELFFKANAAYGAGRYDEAAALYAEFNATYGNSAEAKAALNTTLPRLALTSIRLKKYDAALGQIEEALEKASEMTPEFREELAFWLGACQLQTGDAAAAFDSFAKFGTEYPASPKFAEAGLLAATAKILLEEWDAAAETAANIKEKLDPSNRGRAAVLQLYALTEGGKRDEALAVLTTEYPRMGDMIQIAAFQLMALQLGSVFLEEGEHRKAIAALQRIWSRDALLKHQEARLDVLKKRKAALEVTPGPQSEFELFKANQLIAKVDREIKSFKEIKNFDSSLRLRLASAFLAMERYREAALILEGMLRDLPPDAIVEEASRTLVQSWLAIERWPKAVEAANVFAEKFPKSKTLPLVLYMKGSALQNDWKYEEAVKTFDDVAKRFPKDAIAPRAFFQKGFSQLLAEQYVDAMKSFDEVTSKFSSDEIAESAVYWKGMAFSLNKEDEKARAQLATYMERFSGGRHFADAVFRRAYCAQSMRDFPTAIKEFQAYLADYPMGTNRSEALVLLGDALMNEGDLEAGMAAFSQVDPNDKKFFEEGWFKTGKALRLMEDNTGLRAHMTRFRDVYARSPRVAEAIYWIGWTYRREENEEAARTVYWDAIRELGDDGTIRSVEDLFPALAKLYPGEEGRQVYRQLLKDLQEEADRNEYETLKMRALWAEAKLIARSDPTGSRALLIEAAKSANVQSTNPMLLADFADALRTAGQLNVADQLYKDLVKWNPRAPQKAHAFANRGFIALELGKEAEALDYFERFERDTLGSRDFAKVMLAKSALLVKRGRSEEAQAALEKALASELASGRDKAEALYAIGELNMNAGNHKLAVPYYQRIYVMYGRWTDFVAKAYLRSGEAFEKLNDTESAINTYREMLGREELADFEEITVAKARIVKLGGDPTPQAPPEPAPEEA